MVGVHVVLDIVPQRIEPPAWAEAFEETRTLVEAHPARLLGYGFRAVAGARVPVFTRSVVQGVHDPAERRWCVVGDRATLWAGERQRMYRDLGRYLARCVPSPEAEQDVLLAFATDTPQPGTVRVFGEGEQSEPCRTALLAAAMVVETRFPEAALVSGHFDREQAEGARRWAKGILGRSLALPVRVDAFRLVERLGKHFGGEVLGRAVDRLFLADPPGRDRALTLVLGAAAARRCTARREPEAPATPNDADAAAQPGLEVLANLASPGELTTDQRERVHALAATVRTARRELDDHGGPVSAGTARRAVAGLLARNGPTLTEDAWEWIDREEDPDLCAFLTALAALAPAGEQVGLRRALLENRALCRYAAGLRA
jgi:hypothetical protein